MTKRNAGIGDAINARKDALIAVLEFVRLRRVHRRAQRRVLENRPHAAVPTQNRVRRVLRSDEFGFRVVRDKVSIHDLQATILHLMGLDPYSLSFR